VKLVLHLSHFNRAADPERFADVDPAAPPT